MYGLKDYMEVYKADHTFRIKTPEILDPEETVPNIPWIVSEFPGLGSANIIVARVFIQSAEALSQKSFKEPIDEKRILELMHACKEDLLVCESVLGKLTIEENSILEKIKRQELSLDGNAINPFPQIPDLEASVTTFLTAAKRACQRIAMVFGEFYKVEITNPRFDKMLAHLKQHRPDYCEYIQVLEDNLITVNIILDLRNFHEHPTKDKKTEISDFRLTTKGIRQPSWHVTGNPESPIISDMGMIVNFLIHLAESSFLHCLWDKIGMGNWIPWHLVELPEGKRDKDCPIRYKLEIDISQLPILKQQSE